MSKEKTEGKKGTKSQTKRKKKDCILQLCALCMITIIPYMQEADFNLHAFRHKCHSSPSQRERQKEEVVSLIL